MGEQPETVAAGETVWVTVASSAEVVRIDPVANTIERRIPVQSRPRGIVLAGIEAWFTARAVTGSHRGGTLRIVTDAFSAPTVLDPADPDAQSVTSWDTLLLTNDGLVGFKRVGGSDGLTVVPDLAASIPTPMDGGHTWTFRLRPGITYSDGTPIRAMDVLRSVERVASLSPFAHDVYGSVEGVDACAGAPETCDLSSSVVVDDGAGTVTFRLIAPDSEFLSKLAHPIAVVVPAETPRSVATTPLPATGPYIAEPFDAEGGIRLVRNQTFHEWSHEAQPAGYPEEIVWRIATKGEDPTATVSTGGSDLTLVSEAADRIDELRTQFPDQLHAVPPSMTWFEFMNTTLPPFDRADVRRAVNLATDRAAVVAAYGGPLTGRVTCQAIPPGFPGFEPYCPYTISPDPAGTWRAPDLAAARDLIADAGVSGTPVIVRALDSPEHLAVGAYFVELLDTLGFEATLEPMSLDDLFAVDQTYTAGIQMIGLWMAPFYPSPSVQIAGIFTCPDYRPSPGASGNFAAFCDRDIDARALRAYDLQSTDPPAANRAWAEIDRLIVDQAPAVAAFNPIDLAFASKRVGNVQVHPVLRVLLSQMWVQ